MFIQNIVVPLQYQDETTTKSLYIMTREIITKICKTKKVNLEWYDHIIAYINENYTKVFVTFANLEVVGGSRLFCNKKTITLSVAAIQKREEFEWEYTTQGWERIETIR